MPNRDFRGRFTKGLTEETFMKHSETLLKELDKRIYTIQDEIVIINKWLKAYQLYLNQRKHYLKEQKKRKKK